MLISALSLPSFPLPFGMTAVVFLPPFLLGLLARSSPISSPPLPTTEEEDIAEGGRGGIFVGGGMASDAEDVVLLIPFAFEVVGRRDMM